MTVTKIAKMQLARTERANPGLFAPQTRFGIHGYQPHRNIARYETHENVRSSAAAMSEIVRDLVPTGGKSVFSNFNAVSSDTNVAGTNVDHSRTLAQRPNDINLNIRQTALSQVNSGTAEASAPSALQGTHTFRITANGRTHSFTINVPEGVDNAAVQRQIEQAINSRNIGVTASISAGETAGTSALSLTSNATGNMSAFSVSDSMGNLAQSMGITNITQEARNAFYSVNGGAERMSQTNEVSLSLGVTASLRDAGLTKISFERDTTASLNRARDLVNSINFAISTSKSSHGAGSARYIQDIHAMNKTFSNSLANVGISVHSSGQLSVNNEKLTQAAQNGSLEQLFSNSSSGYGARIQMVTERATKTSFYANAPVSFEFANHQARVLMKNQFINFMTIGRVPSSIDLMV
jgi:hypothetical protein